MKGIGLVFAGGGGKGAYQIGVWKFLHEKGLDKFVRIVSGTSVGALNAALFSGSTFEKAESIWLNIEPEQILTPKKITEKDVIRWLTEIGLASLSPFLNTPVKRVSMAAQEALIPLANQMMIYWQTNHLFSRAGIKKLIAEGLDNNRLYRWDVPCYATCLEIPRMKKERFQLNEYSFQEIERILLASSAIPIIFKNEEIEGKTYCDGGVPVIGDNVPIKPVYDSGVENIIVIHLSQDEMIDRTLYPNARIIEVIPQADLGGAIEGTLDFTPEGSRWRIEQGYQDVSQILEPMIEILELNVLNRQILREEKRRQKNFLEKQSYFYQREQSIAERKKADGFNVVYQELMGGW